MTILKVRNSWKHVGTMPLLRALILDGAIYYCVFIFAYGLNLFASAMNEVGVLHLYYVK